MNMKEKSAQLAIAKSNLQVHVVIMIMCILFAFMCFIVGGDMMHAGRILAGVTLVVVGSGLVGVFIWTKKAFNKLNAAYYEALLDLSSNS